LTVAEIITDIKEHGFTDYTDAQLVSIINDAVWDIDSREQWPYLDTSIDLTFAASSSTASNFPAQFSKVLSVVNASTGVVLVPEAFDVIRKSYPTALTTTGEPTRYYFIGTQFNVYPVPGAATTLKMAYTQWQTELTAASIETAILLPPRHHRLIVLKSLENIYLKEDDLQTSNFFSNLFDKRFANMTYDMTMQQFDRPQRIYSVDFDEGWDYYDS